MHAERPEVWLWNRLDHNLDIVMPTVEVGRKLLVAANGRPRFSAPIIALYDSDKVQEFATSNWIFHHMSSGPNPGLGNAISEPRRQRRERDHATPCDEARKLWLVGAMQAGSDDRVNAIGTNQRVSRYGAAVGEQQCHCVGVLPAACCNTAEVN